jgi:DNA-binding NarL/FixJ family response regulator
MELSGAALQGGDDWAAAFQLLFETTATPVAILDERRRLVDLNVPAQRLLGHCPSHRAGEPIIGAVVASERLRSVADWERLLREGRAAGTRTLIGSDGAELKIAYTAVVEAVPGGRRAVYTLAPAVASPLQTNSLDVRSQPPTRREAQVIRLIADGLDTAEIADTLQVSPNTVRSHVRNAMSKLGARTRAQLVARALGIGEG